jgi:hypothetical protein
VVGLQNRGILSNQGPGGDAIEQVLGLSDITRRPSCETPAGGASEGFYRGMYPSVASSRGSGRSPVAAIYCGVENHVLWTWSECGFAVSTTQWSSSV